MKFYTLTGYRHSAYIHKFLLVMKLTIVLLITAFVQISFAARAQKITFSGKNASIIQVFAEIQNQTGYTFLYTDEMLDGASPLNVDFKNTPLAEALNKCFLNQPLTYTVKNKVIIVQRKLPEPEPLVALQAVIVRGKVTDEKGEPLPGVTIALKGKAINTVTDNAGTYTITIPSGETNAVLAFSFVGFDAKEVVVGNQTIINIKLTVTDNKLNEIVVVGYGTQKRATLTGSVATVNAKAFEDKGSLANPFQALQGQVPGVLITRGSAAPGNEGWNINIRGASSINPTDALVVIDGVAAVGVRSLDAINPNDIESMSFLKDASAAIYGARAAGGVVLITTKKAKSGKTVVQYDGSFSSKIVGLQPHLMNVEQWANGVITARRNDGFDDSDVWIKYGKLALANLNNYIDIKTYGSNPLPNFSDVNDYVFFNNSWTNVLWGTANSTQNNLSVAGRTEKAGYRISLGYMDDGSILRWGNNSNKRYNVRLANDFLIGGKVKIESNIAYDRNDVLTPTLINNVLGQYAQPGMPISTINGGPYAWGGQLNPNWQAKLGGDNRLTKANVYINEKINYDILKSLKFVATLGYNTNNANRYTQQNSIQWYNYLGTVPGITNPTQDASYFKRANLGEDYYNANAYFEYKNTFSTDHSVSVTAGSQYERDEYDYFDATVLNPVSQDIKTLTGIGNQTNSETKNHYAIGSAFSRVNYAYKQRYLLEANFRYDGSSKFAEEDRWKAFYGFSAGWRISQENFMKGVTFFNDLKLRASYGVVGNQSGIGLYDYIQQLVLTKTGTVTSNNPILGSGQAVTVGPTNGLVSLNRTWERIRNSNIALDFSILNSRLTGTAEYFIKDNSNMLLPQTYPTILGAQAPAANIGHLKTNGWEVSLSWADKIGEIGYNVGGNISYNKNKLININGATTIYGGYNAATQGYPIGSVFGLEYAGRIQTQEQADAATKLIAGSDIPGGSYTTHIGDNSYKDLNGDGKITSADYKYLGTDDPRYSYSFNAGVQWKGFDISVIFQGVGSRTIFRNGDVWRVPFSAVYLNTTNQSVNNNWTPENTGAYYPKYSTNGTVNSYNYQPSSWSVENGAYLRLKNAVIGYTIPQKLISATNFISKLRVYISGNDLWEITKIKDGWDPEAPRNVITTDGSPYYGRYPFYRYLTAGVNVTF